MRDLLYNHKNKKAVLLYVVIIFLILSFNSYNIYSQGKTNDTNELKQNNVTRNNTNPIINTNSTLINQQITTTLTKLINSKLINNSGAISKPVGNVTTIFGPLGQIFPIYFLAIVALAMVIPLVIDMILAYIMVYKRGSKEGKKEISKPAVGIHGLYMTLMTFGIVL